MSRFYAEIHGQAKTSATRTGSTNSGISGHIRGWECGVQVDGQSATIAPEKDVFVVSLTSGSSNRYGRKTIGYIVLDDNGRPVFTPSADLSTAIENEKDLVL